MKGTDCSKSPSAKLVFACSGAADVGELADLAARKINREGLAKMFCTVGLGGKVEPILETTKASDTILALDGCPLDCTRRSLEEAGFENYLHLRVTDIGLTKGKTEITDAAISTVVEQAAALLH
jgi:uncharacterized metal-binding protein